MKRFTLSSLALLLLAAAGAQSFEVRLSYFNIEQENNDFILLWQAEEEEDVRHYEVYRKTSFIAEFERIQEITAHGPNKEYRFKDDQVYKSASEELDYRLDVVFTNGLRQQVAARKLNYTPTAIRRTWGSIKAMFQ